ncbi:hypothetical protein SFC57_11235 [Niallia circulans]|nr:hypothetical protein [Niallia circulans]
MIVHGWLEQPPIESDRDGLIGKCVLFNLLGLKYFCPIIVYF